jgi:hypothetical protein
MTILDLINSKDRDEVVDAALQDKHDALKRKGELASDIEKLRSQVAGKRRERAAAEYSGADWQSVDEQIVSLQADIEVKEGAIELANEKVRDADRRLHLAAHRGWLKTARKLGNQRVKAAQQLSDAIALYLKARVKILEVGAAIASSWPLPGQAPNEAVISIADLDRMIGIEILRVEGLHPLSRRPPGATNSPYIELSDLVPLADQLEQANSLVVRLIEQGPTAPVAALPEVPPEVSVIEAMPDPDGLDLPAQQTVSIAEAQALMSKHSEITIDNRKNMGGPNEPA